MEDLIIDGQVFEFTVVTGEILSQNKFSETHVSGGGGGGAHGHSSNISISSRAITKHEFWIKTDDGKEKAIQLEGHDIPLREGQRISVISLWEKKMQRGYTAMLINHTSGDVIKLLDIQRLSQLKAGFKDKFIWWVSLLSAGAGFIIAKSSHFRNDDAGAVALIAGVASFFLVGIIGLIMHPKILKRKLGFINDYLDKLADDLLAKGK